jgi:DNA polymerase-3 subunit alpha
MLANGYSKNAVKVLWDTLLPFADYAFNKAHSAGYGVLSYWTGYLKANHPAEFMAALLTSVGDSKDKLGMYLSECRRMGIHVLAPDVNESSVDFTAVGGDVRFGLGAVRNVGYNVVEAITSARESKGRFTSFHDFLGKVPLQVINKRTIESLIKAGAFDSLGNTRRALYDAHERVIDDHIKTKKDAEDNARTGQMGLFDIELDQVSVTDRPEWPKRNKLAFEREMLGLYVSDHPLSGMEARLLKLASSSIAEVLSGDEAREGEHVTIAGLITGVQHRVARNSGNQYGIVQVEDFGAEITVMFLGKTYQEFSPALTNDSIVVIRGRISMRDDGMNLHAVSLSTPDLGQSLGSGPLIISMPDIRATPEVVGAMNDVLIRHAGDTEVRVRLIKESTATARDYDVPFPVQVSADLYGELKTLLGPQCLA